MSEKDLKAAIRTIMAAKRADVDAPSPDELLSFRADLLADEDRERLLERAAASPATARALLDARRFPEVEPVDEEMRVTEKDVAHHWSRFEERLRQKEPTQTSEAPPKRPALRLLPSFPSLGRWLSSRFHSLRLAQAVAAALLLVSLGLSWTLVVQRRPTHDDARPRLNLPIVELIPEGEAGERTEARSLQVPATADAILLVLTLRDRRSYRAYEVKIRDSGGGVVWSSTALQRAPEGFFTLELPRRFLPAGRYRIAVRGIDGDRPEPVATYGLEIEE